MVKFDTFINAVIHSEVNVSEPISVLYREDFHNGYGYESLLTHINTLYKQLTFSNAKKITLNTFHKHAYDYVGIKKHDMKLAFNIIAPENDFIDFRILKKFIISIRIESIRTIMQTVEAERISTTYLEQAISHIYSSLTTEIPVNKNNDINLLDSISEPYHSSDSDVDSESEPDSVATVVAYSTAKDTDIHSDIPNTSSLSRIEKKYKATQENKKKQVFDNNKSYFRTFTNYISNVFSCSLRRTK